MIRTILAFGFALLIAACATPTKYAVNVSSLASPQINNSQTFDVVPRDSSIQKTDLQFQEYKSYVVRALQANGFKPMEDGAPPEMVVFLDYGIGDPQTKVQSYSVPVFGKTGVSSANTTGTYTNKTYNQTTTYTPSYGITGYRSGVTSYDVYTRRIVIEGFLLADWETKGELIPAFETAILSTGSSGDLRAVFPIMIGAASQYIGRSTDKSVAVQIGESDARVIAIKGTSGAER
jgi:hypothetical protein